MLSEDRVRRIRGLVACDVANIQEYREFCDDLLADRAELTAEVERLRLALGTATKHARDRNAEAEQMAMQWDLREKAVELQRAEVKRLTAEVERLKARCMKTYCAYCGAEFPVDEPSDTRDIGEHIKVCPKHPMRDVEAEVERLKDLDRQDRELAETHRLRVDALAGALHGVAIYRLDGQDCWCSHNYNWPDHEKECLAAHAALASIPATPAPPLPEPATSPLAEPSAPPSPNRLSEAARALLAIHDSPHTATATRLANAVMALHAALDEHDAGPKAGAIAADGLVKAAESVAIDLAEWATEARSEYQDRMAGNLQKLADRLTSALVAHAAGTETPMEGTTR